MMYSYGAPTEIRAAPVRSKFVSIYGKPTILTKIDIPGQAARTVVGESAFVPPAAKGEAATVPSAAVGETTAGVVAILARSMRPKPITERGGEEIPGQAARTLEPQAAAITA